LFADCEPIKLACNSRPRHTTQWE